MVADPSASQGHGPVSGDGTGSDLTSLDPETRQSVRILVIDDDRALRESTASFLGAEGYSVTVCGRGDEALGIVKRRKFDVVLIDLYMSQVPGIELLNACLGTHRDT